MHIWPFALLLSVGTPRVTPAAPPLTETETPQSPTSTVPALVWGRSTIDGVETALVVSTPSQSRVIATVAHARGMVPRGVVVGDGAEAALWLAMRDPTSREALWRVPLLLGASPTRYLDGALSTHAPTVDRSGAVIAVVPAANTSGVFSVVRARDGAVLASDVHAGWLTPVRGAPGAFLATASTSASQLLTLGQRATPSAALPMEVVASLPSGSYRSPVYVGGAWWIERTTQKHGVPHAQVQRVTAVDGGATVVAEGLVDLSPTRCDEHTLVVGTGEKSAGVDVIGIEAGAVVSRGRLMLGRAGVASPQACVVDTDGVAHVAVRLNRGASLPFELWHVSELATQPIALPASSSSPAAFSVYGWLDGTAAQAVVGGGR